MGEIKPLVFMPAGTRWPWLPCFTTNVKAGPLEPGETEEGPVMNVTLTVVGEVHHGRIGLKRWAKINARKITKRT